MGSALASPTIPPLGDTGPWDGGRAGRGLPGGSICLGDSERKDVFPGSPSSVFSLGLLSTAGHLAALITMKTEACGSRLSSYHLCNATVILCVRVLSPDFWGLNVLICLQLDVGCLFQLRPKSPYTLTLFHRLGAAMEHSQQSTTQRMPTEYSSRL